jgi:Yos1-like
MLFLGGIFYIGLLLINAVAVLSEDRFLARSACPIFGCTLFHHSHTFPGLQSDGQLFSHRIMLGFNKIMIRALDTGTLRRILA